MLKRNKY